MVSAFPFLATLSFLANFGRGALHVYSLVKSGNPTKGETHKTQQSASQTPWATQYEPPIPQQRREKKSGRKLSILCGQPTGQEVQIHGKIDCITSSNHKATFVHWILLYCFSCFPYCGGF